MNSSAFAYVASDILLSQVGFQNNTAVLGGDDIFMDPPMFCPGLKFVDQPYGTTELNGPSLVVVAKTRTPLSFFVMDGGGCMCQKKVNNTLWLLKNCNDSIVELYR